MESLRKSINVRASWELEFTGRETIKEKMDSIIQSIVEGMQEMGPEAASAAEMMLVSMGDIDPKSIKAYIAVQQLLADIDALIEGHVPPSIISSYALGQIGAIQNDPALGLATALGDWVKKGVMGVGAKPNTSAWWSEKTQEWFFGNQPPEMKIKPVLDTVDMKSDIDPSAWGLDTIISQYGDIQEKDGELDKTIDTNTGTMVTSIDERKTAVNNLHSVVDDSSGAVGSTVVVPPPSTGGKVKARARGGSFSGWAMVGDAPGGQRTPYTEYVYAPQGAVVYNQAQMSGKAAPPMASGGMISRAGKIELDPRTIRRMGEEIGKQLATAIG
jgi:hypothetical protein